MEPNYFTCQGRAFRVDDTVEAVCSRVRSRLGLRAKPIVVEVGLGLRGRAGPGLDYGTLSPTLPAAPWTPTSGPPNNCVPRKLKRHASRNAKGDTDQLRAAPDPDQPLPEAMKFFRDRLQRRGEPPCPSCQAFLRAPRLRKELLRAGPWSVPRRRPWSVPRRQAFPRAPRLRKELFRAEGAAAAAWRAAGGRVN